MPQFVAMGYRVDTRPNGTEIALSGTLTYSDYDTFLGILGSISSAGSEPNDGSAIILDISELTFVDSCGLGLFLMAHEEATKQGRSLQLKSPRTEVLRSLRLANFDMFITITDVGQQKQL